MISQINIRILIKQMLKLVLCDVFQWISSNKHTVWCKNTTCKTVYIIFGHSKSKSYSACYISVYCSDEAHYVIDGSNSSLSWYTTVVSSTFPGFYSVNLQIFYLTWDTLRCISHHKLHLTQTNRIQCNRRKTPLT